MERRLSEESFMRCNSLRTSESCLRLSLVSPPRFRHNPRPISFNAPIYSPIKKLDVTGNMGARDNVTEA